MGGAVNKASILDTLMQGTARRPLIPEGVLGEGIAPAEPCTAPRLMALAVQAELFAMPLVPTEFDEVAAQDDPRSIVPEAARPLILRLVSGKGNPPDDAAALALALALEAGGLRLHPFDLPRLNAFVRKHSDVLGQAMTGRNDESAERVGDWFASDALDPTNWTLATPARKATFIAQLRGSDPASARALVEAQLPVEKADVRLRLIDALATGLSGDDRTFLESLANDRAPTVKQAVTRLLARLPGTGAAAAQIEELVSRIAAGKAGLLRKRITLKLQLPANLKGPAPITEWLAANFGAVNSSSLGAAFGMSGDAMLEAAQGDDDLVKGIAFAACAGREWSLLEDIARRYVPHIWAEFLQPGLAAFGVVLPAERSQWISAVIPGAVAPASLNPWVLTALHEAFAGPLPAAQARALFAGALKASHPSAELFTATAALMPLELLSEVRASFGRLPPELGARANSLIATLICLNQGTTQP